MEQHPVDLLSECDLQINTRERKELIPWWVKFFMWIFLTLGGLAFIGLIFGILGYSFQLAIYGLETNEPVSLIGISVIAIFLLKGITSFGLITQKVWAVTFGMIDAIIGILICIITMLFPINSWIAE